MFAERRGKQWLDNRKIVCVPRIGAGEEAGASRDERRILREAGMRRGGF